MDNIKLNILMSATKSMLGLNINLLPPLSSWPNANFFKSVMSKHADGYVDYVEDDEISITSSSNNGPGEVNLTISVYLGEISIYASTRFGDVGEHDEQIEVQGSWEYVGPIQTEEQFEHAFIRMLNVNPNWYDVNQVIDNGSIKILDIGVEEIN